MIVPSLKNSKQRVLVLAGAVALSLTMVVPALADNSVSTTLSSGTLTASYASDASINLGSSVTYSKSSRDLPEFSSTLRVDDATNTFGGWSVTMIASTFAHGSYANSNISASNFKVTSIDTPEVVVGQAIGNGENEGPEDVADSIGLGLNSERTIVQAFEGFGNGVYDTEVGLTLTVPGYSRPGTYASTITVTTAAAPTAP